MNGKGTKLNEHLDFWCQGIISEIRFWDNMMKTGGGVCNKQEWQKIISPLRLFELETDIPKEAYGKEYKFIDVGSGPFSRCGFCTDKVKLKHFAMDPLADIYNVLKANVGLENEVNLQSGFVELLDKYVKPNSFDMVHMSNSLDHSFDPILGIYQLLNATKIGGKVILRHNDNEGEHADYQGFHQWNFSVNIDTNIFKIDGQGINYDINEIFGDYAEISCSRDLVLPQLHKVVFVKKKDVVIPENDLYDKVFKSVYAYMLKSIMCEVLFDNREIFVNDVISRINTLSLEKLYTNFGKKKRIVLYGYGRIGKALFQKLIHTNIEIPLVIDAYQKSTLDVEVRKIDEFEFDSTIDEIVVTIYGNDYSVFEKLKEKGYKESQIWRVDKFIEKSF